jgi:hypothetical protein
MVPNSFTAEEIEIVRKFIIKAIHQNSRFVNGKVLGNPYIFYKDVLVQLEYVIESEHDGDRVGILVGEASIAEFQTSKLLISAVVVSKEYRRPGSGFYQLAENKGLFNNSKKINPDGLRELTFWNQHVSQIVQYYGGK